MRFFSTLLMLTCLMGACHRAVPESPTGLLSFFSDTGRVVPLPEARTFSLQKPGQRDSLRMALSRERALWRANSLSDYRFLLRTACFCPGGRGWLLIEVRTGQPLRAWDRAGRSAPVSDWDTFSIDGLFERLEQSADRDAAVQVSFDPRWHFPTYAYTRALPGPDMWGIIEARGFRPF